MGLTLTLRIRFEALNSWIAVASAFWERLTAVVLFTPSAVPFNPTQPASAVALWPKQNPATITASAKALQYDFIEASLKPR